MRIARKAAHQSATTPTVTLSRVSEPTHAPVLKGPQITPICADCEFPNSGIENGCR